jgi:PAS domain S-box-containing protein
MNSEVEGSVSSNPQTALSVALVLTALVLAGLAWTAVVSIKQAEEVSRRNRRVDGLRATIGRLDEVLTMSARMCAVTGDPQWEARYRTFEPQLESAIREALSLAPDTGAADAVAHTDAANIALVEMENRAFDLIRQNHLEDARAILFSGAYDGQKRVYAAGMEQLDASLAASVQRAVEGETRRVRIVPLISAVAMSLLVLCWFVALRTMNRGNAALVRSYERLSRQSVELAQLNAELDRETQFRVSEGRLRAVLDAALDAVIGMDAEEVITYWNPRAEAIFGWRREEAFGKRLRDLIIPERYREGHSRGLARFLTSGEGPILNRRTELHGLRRDGTEFPVELSITAVKQGETYSFSGFLADITERKRAEAELRRYADVFRNIQLGLNVWCLQDRADLRSFKLISTNPAAAHSLGVRTEDVLGKRMGDAFPHMLDTDLPRQYREVVVSEEGRDLGEVRGALGESADDGVFSVKVFPLPGDCVGVAFENITERRRLESQLLHAQKMEAVGRLAGGVAHDFNNALGVILGYTELLMRGAGEAQRAKLEQILKATQRASALTRQLLAFSRKQIVDPKVLDLNALLSDLEKMLRRLIGEHIDLAIVPGANLGRVKADPGQLEQVVMNLCVNARDAMPDGGLLRIETANAELDAGQAARHKPMVAGRYVVLDVGDAGCGIEKDILSKIFEPFFTTKEQGQGTGLGLAMVYGIVKQAGGYVWVDSEVGRGTTFKIYLPRIDDVAEAPAVQETPMPSKGSETILLVEDERSLRAIAREILEEHGYQVIEATGPNEAIEIAHRYPGPIHLLLTDIVMPQMNGRVMAESLVAAHPELRVLYMSGYTDDVLAHSGVLESGTLLLEKPFTSLALLGRVRAALGERGAAANA